MTNKKKVFGAPNVCSQSSLDLCSPAASIEANTRTTVPGTVTANPASTQEVSPASLRSSTYLDGLLAGGAVLSRQQ